MQIEMLDSLEDRMAALVEEQDTVRKGFQIIFKRCSSMSTKMQEELRILSDIVHGKIRHELSLLVQENESKNNHRRMDSTRDNLPDGHNNISVELNPAARDSSI